MDLQIQHFMEQGARGAGKITLMRSASHKLIPEPLQHGASSYLSLQLPPKVCVQSYPLHPQQHQQLAGPAPPLRGLQHGEGE